MPLESAPVQFSSPVEQRETSVFAMWVFLATEVMFFGSAIGAYLIMYFLHPTAFEAASRHMDVALGGLNTAVLLVSSYAIALAVGSAEAGRERRLFWLLIIAAALGVVFLGIKAVEYTQHARDGLWPGANFQWTEPDPGAARIFFTFYFLLTGLHALHVFAGVVMWLIIAFFVRRGRYNATYYSPVEVAGLYWHFVDIVWVFLYPFLYLIGNR